MASSSLGLLAERPVALSSSSSLAPALAPIPFTASSSPSSSCSASSLLPQRTQPSLAAAVQAWLLSPIPFHKMGSFYDVIRRCNKLKETEISDMWEFCILDNSVPVGYMLSEYANTMRWEDTSFRVSRRERKIHLNPLVRLGDDVVEICRREFAALCEKNADKFNGCFQRWLDTKSDYHPIRGLDVKLAGLVIASPARGIFGIVTTGVHMNMFTVKNGKIHIWVSKRSQSVTYAGKLDQVVAGAMDPEDGMNPLVALGREAMEEAGLQVDISSGTVTRDGGRVGRVTAETQISFYDQKDDIAGSERGHVEPGIRYTFDLEVEPSFVPCPQEPQSSDRFMLKPVEEVKLDLKNAEWKPNCGLVMLDFLLRKGEIRQGDDEHFGLLKHGLQRVLPFHNL